MCVSMCQISFFSFYDETFMDSQVELSIMKGRPFGGTGFIFNRMLSNSLRGRTDLKHPRVSVMELSVTNHNLLLIKSIESTGEGSTFLNTDVYNVE